MIVLVFNSILLGVGLAMDAFSVSLANGLHEPNMKSGRVRLIAGTFAAFQFAMPMIGWTAVSFAENAFKSFYKAVPFIALGLLAFLGIKMIIDGTKQKPDDGEEYKCLTLSTLMLQGIATSIDALSVGFTTASYSVWDAVLSAAIIGVMTFGICIAGVYIGRKAGTRLAGKATITGGAILIVIGIEIFLTNILA